MKHILLLALLLLAGCRERTALQSTLPTRALEIGDHTLRVEVADTPETMRVGLMFRESMPEDQGMLFVFAKPQRASFWMKNTLIPLSIAYVDFRGIILEIHDLEPKNTAPVESKTDDIAFAIETNRGWFEENNIRAGEQIRGLPRF